MNRSTGAAITTACISAAVGTAAYMAVNHSKGSSARAKKLKKTTGRALRQVGDFIDNMSYMMR